MQGGLGGATAVLRSPREQLPQSGAGLDPPQLWQECPCVLFGVGRLKQPFLAAVWPSPFSANAKGWVAPGHTLECARSHCTSR